MAQLQLAGTDQFRDLAAKLRTAGSFGGGLKKQLVTGLRQGARPIQQRAQANVRGLQVKGVRGGASARAARTAARLGKRKAGDRGKLRAHRSSGLRASVARTVSTNISVTAKGGTLSVRSTGRQMPPEQKNLPKHMNKGRIRHPVFGRRDAWVTQVMAPDWFDEAGRTEGPKAVQGAITTTRIYLNRLL